MKKWLARRKGDQVNPKNQNHQSLQKNRKKKAEPGTMCEDDLEKVEMPIDSMFPSANKLEVTENGDIENSPEPAPAPAD